MKPTTKMFIAAFSGVCVAGSFIFALMAVGDLLGDYMSMKMCLRNAQSAEQAWACRK